MRLIQSLLVRLHSLFTREASNRAVREELEFHLEQAIAQNVAAGMSLEAARIAARESFGSMAEATEQCHGARGTAWLEDLIQDTRYAVHTFSRHWSFTLLTVLTLALGIGACSAIFSLADAVLIRSLPYQDSERLVYLFTPNIHYDLPADMIAPSKPDFFDLKRQSRSYRSMAMFEQATYSLAVTGESQRAGVAKVDAGFFATLGVDPLFGRTVDGADLEPSKDQVALISYALWQRMFAGASNVLGKQVLLDGEGYRVIGVMPADMAYPHRSDLAAANGHIDRTDVWIPLALTPQQRAQRGGSWGYALARLKPGVSIRDAQSEMNTIMARLNLLHSPDDRGWSGYVKSFRDAALDPVRPLMWLLLGAVATVFVVACGNAASMFLIWIANRAHELGVRATLGAGAQRLLRQMLAETLMLSILAGITGIGFAWILLRLLIRLNPGDIPGVAATTMNFNLLGSLTLVTAVTSVLFSLLPAIAVTRVNPAEFLQKRGMHGLVGDNNRVRKLLVMAQVAFGVLLLTVSGLLLRSYVNVLAAPMGFSPSTVTANIAFSPEILERPVNPNFKTAAKRRLFMESALEKFKQLPGVQAAGAINNLPLTHWFTRTTLQVEGYPNKRNQVVAFRLVTPDYFSSMGIPLIRGRGFSDDDGLGKPLAVVVNEAMARKYFGTVDAVGRRLRKGPLESWTTVVGVVGDVRSASREAATVPEMYVSFWQGDTDVGPAAGVDFTVRSPLPAETVMQGMRAAMRSIDPNLALANLGTMNDLESQASARRRFQTALMTLFAAVAMLLAVIGVYGLIAYSVQQRTGEIGIRMALGGTRSGIVMLVLQEAMWLLASGLGIGLAAALGLTRLLKGFLYQVPAVDPATYTVVFLLLIAATVTACVFPSMRAAAIDPADALRHE
jgi:predicted permease